MTSAARIQEMKFAKKIIKELKPIFNDINREKHIINNTDEYNFKCKYGDIVPSRFYFLFNEAKKKDKTPIMIMKSSGKRYEELALLRFSDLKQLLEKACIIPNDVNTIGGRMERVDNIQ